MKIAGDCIVLIPDNDEIHELRKQLQQIKKAFIGLKGEVEGERPTKCRVDWNRNCSPMDGQFSMTNDSEENTSWLL